MFNKSTYFLLMMSASTFAFSASAPSPYFLPSIADVLAPLMRARDDHYYYPMSDDDLAVGTSALLPARVTTVRILPPMDQFTDITREIMGTLPSVPVVHYGIPSQVSDLPTYEEVMGISPVFSLSRPDASGVGVVPYIDYSFAGILEPFKGIAEVYPFDDVLVPSNPMLSQISERSLIILHKFLQALHYNNADLKGAFLARRKYVISKAFESFLSRGLFNLAEIILRANHENSNFNPTDEEMLVDLKEYYKLLSYGGAKLDTFVPCNTSTLNDIIFMIMCFSPRGGIQKVETFLQRYPITPYGFMNGLYLTVFGKSKQNLIHLAQSDAVKKLLINREELMLFFDQLLEKADEILPEKMDYIRFLIAKVSFSPYESSLRKEIVQTMIKKIIGTQKQHLAEFYAFLRPRLTSDNLQHLFKYSLFIKNFGMTDVVLGDRDPEKSVTVETIRTSLNSAILNNNVDQARYLLCGDAIVKGRADLHLPNAELHEMKQRIQHTRPEIYALLKFIR